MSEKITKITDAIPEGALHRAKCFDAILRPPKDGIIGKPAPTMRQMLSAGEEFLGRKDLEITLVDTDAEELYRQEKE